MTVQLCLFLLVIFSNMIRADDIPENRSEVIYQDAMQNNCPPVSQWQRFISRYTSTCIPAIVIGSACGSGCHFTDQFIAWPIDWLLWRGIRLGISNSVKKNMKDCNVECDETVFDYVVLISAWVNYFASLKNKTTII